MRVVAAAVTALLAGCVDPLSQLERQISHYKGQKIDALIDRIGYPDSQSLIAGGVVYIWTTATSLQLEPPSIQTPALEVLGGQVLAKGSAPAPVDVHFRCTLQVDTDGAGTILRLSWKGRLAGCTS